jgi:hypothetical protein
MSETVIGDPEFIQRYMDYASFDPYPRSFHKHCAMTLLALAVGRRCVLEWGRFPILPMQHCVFIADSGEGKSACITIMRKLVRELFPTLEVISRQATFAGILGALPVSDGRMTAPVLIEAGEMTSLINTSDHQRDIVSGLCDLMDNNYYDKTLRRERTRIDGIQVVVILASNEAMLLKHSPSSIIDGGLGSRVVWLSDEALPHDIGDMYDESDVAVQRAKRLMAEALLEIFNRTQAGEPAFVGERGRAWLKQWQVDGHYRKKPAEKIYKGYFSRRHITLLRYALVSALCNGRIEVTGDDLAWGWKTLSEGEEDMFGIFDRLRQSEHGRCEQEVLDFVYARNGCSGAMLRRKFHSRWKGAKYVDYIIESLKSGGRITGTDDKYHIVEDGV